MRGIALEVDGKVEAYGGIMYSSPMQCFSWSSKLAQKRYRKTIYRMGKMVGEIMDSVNAPIYAKRDKDEPTAHNFLRRLGFEQVDEETYRWHRQHHS